jgi:hypothetical protein
VLLTAFPTYWLIRSSLNPIAPAGSRTPRGSLS